MNLLNDKRIMERLIGRENNRTEIRGMEAYKKRGERLFHGFRRWRRPYHVEVAPGMRNFGGKG